MSVEFFGFLNKSTIIFRKFVLRLSKDVRVKSTFAPGIKIKLMAAVS